MSEQCADLARVLGVWELANCKLNLFYKDKLGGVF